MNTRAKKIACWSVVMGTIVVVDVGWLNVDRVTVCVLASGDPPTQPIGQTKNLRPVSEVAPLIKMLVRSTESIAKREGRRGLRILDEGLGHPNEQIRWVSALLLRRMRHEIGKPPR